MGPYRPRHSAPKNVSNGRSNNQTNGPLSPLGPQPFINTPNQFVPMQNNQMGFPLSAPIVFPGQSFPGFLPQYNGSGMNNAAVFPTNGPYRMPNFNQMSLSQPGAQFQNIPNFAQLMNQNMGIPNGQLGMQNMNQFYAMQMATLAQLGSFNVPASHQMLGSLNQVNPGMNPQNPAFFGTTPYGAACSSDGRMNQIMAQPPIEQKELPDAPGQLERNSPLPSNSHSAHEGQALENMQSFQGNSAINGHSNMSNSWKHSPKNNFRDRSQIGRWENTKFASGANAKRKFDGSRDNENRGGFNRRQKTNNNTSLSNQDTPQPKRSISVSYTEQEVQQWRDQRRKNHPSRANKDELHKEKLTGEESIERDERLRREQLKEVLAKQAELGVEVADIPAHYLLDSENQEGQKNKGDSNNKDTSRNRRKKQGRNKSRRQSAKRQQISHNESSNGPSSTSREPSLLQKLLSADIKRDKQHLLRVFRFMVINNFLKDAFDKPLEYPVALVKDAKCEMTIVKDALPSAASASLPGILTNEDFPAQDCDHESHDESKIVNSNCDEEAISADEEGEITG
ncbi:hypothetical protein QQ045_005300 [Rhodiola kirilowii]